ncbi:MAG TPA: glycosyltransferase, partial [Chloroflexi bacterium]|nr:glycosyltransferase [Chloroflexota bacterium]
MGRILILAPQAPFPPRQGTALRNWGILRGLAAHHELSLLTFAAPDQPQEPAPPLAAALDRCAILPQPQRTSAARLKTLLTSRRPDLAHRLASETFAAQLRRWLDEITFDWILVEGLELAPYLDVVWAREARPRVAFDDHNCEYLLQRRAFQTDLRQPRRWPLAAYSYIQWQRLRRYEADICRRADLVIAVSDADAAALRALDPALEPLVLNNGLAVREYADFTERAPLDMPAFVFTGTMDFRPNVDGMLWFAHEVWPQIRAALPEATCYVVGRRPHPRLEPLRALPGMVITGGVPETRAYIGAATVYIVPLRVGGGTRLKLLESMAMRRAIVATPLGAEGFPAPERALALAETADDFAAACIRLAQDPAARAA